MSKEPQTVDEYIAAAPPKARPALKALRKAIKAAAPQAQELISYRIASYKQSGYLVGFASFEKHCSLYPVRKSLQQKLKKELAGFDVQGAATLRFTPANPLPASLVKKIVKARIAENKDR